MSERLRTNLIVVNSICHMRLTRNVCHAGDMSNAKVTFEADKILLYTTPLIGSPGWRQCLLRKPFFRIPTKVRT